MFTYSIANNHYNKYTTKTANSIPELLKDLATKCVSPVTDYMDKELTSVETGKVWNSKQHRSNATIVSRGNLGMIDFEGDKDKLVELLNKIEGKSLFYVAIPSQSNKSDKKNARFHIMYKLTTPYTINSESYKVQAKKFFEYINYKWDDSESGIDTRASFNGCGYFAPTIQLKTDKGKGVKEIKDPYITLDDIAKDTLMSKFDEAYTPTKADSTVPNEEFNAVTRRGKKVRGKTLTKISRTLTKGYVLSADSHIETSPGKYMTFEKLVDSLADVEGENPRISMLGCPICNEGHTAPSTIGYAYMQYDNSDKPYIMCTGNACELRPFFTMAEGNIQVYRVDDAAGISKYVMFEDEQIILTHDRDMTYKLSTPALADELYNRGQGEIVDGEYNVPATIVKYTKGCESVQLNHDPFSKQGLDIYEKTFNISPPALFEPTIETPNKVTFEAIKAFEDDAKILSYPISLIYLSYYIFHHKQIMAVLFLVNAKRGSGKSFWVLELIQWYLGRSKVSGMGSSAILAGWDDEKFGRRLVTYEDIENLTKKELGKLASDIKSDATAGDSKMLNIKGIGKKMSYGFNSAGTSNHFNQIPFDGPGDRRIYPSPFKMLDTSDYLASELRVGAFNMVKNRTNIINYLFSIYTDCEKNGDYQLDNALYYKVPHSTIRDVVEDSTSTDGNMAMNIISRARSSRVATKLLMEVVANDVTNKNVRGLMDDIEFIKTEVRIPIKVIKDLWELLPSGKDSMKSLNNRSLLRIFGIDNEIVNVRINKEQNKGVRVVR